MKTYSNIYRFPKQRSKSPGKNTGAVKTDRRRPLTAADAAPEQRAAFVRRTYSHLAGALAAYISLEFLLFGSGFAQFITFVIFTRGRLLLMFVFVLLAGLLIGKEMTDAKAGLTRYLGFGLYVLMQTLASVPVFCLVEKNGGGVLLLESGVVSIGLFSGLTAVAFLTRKNFSFLAPILAIGAFLTLAYAVAGIIFGFSLSGTFSLALIAIAGVWILYQTSNIMRHYQPHQYMAASLSLFSSLALLFWFILRFSGNSKKEYML